MRRRPINTDADGNAKTIPAGYYKSGFTNLTRRMGGGERRLRGHRDNGDNGINGNGGWGRHR